MHAQSTHLFAKMFLLSISILGLNNFEPQMLFAHLLRPRHEIQGLAPGIALFGVSCASQFLLVMTVNKELERSSKRSGE